MTHNSRVAILLLALVVLAMGTGCNNDDATPTAEVITGEETLDEIITDTVEVVEDGASALCSMCLVGEKLGGDDCNCNNICDAEIVCQETN